MNHKTTLNSTSCAICGCQENSKELYPANFSPQDLNPEIFSARRIPDKIHYRIVICKTCGLVRSDPIIDQTTLSDLYARSIQTYDGEVGNLLNTYIRYLDKAVKSLSNDAGKDSLLEIGCGSGFFLEKALDYGFKHVSGVEPSHQAVEKSNQNVKSRILCDILRPGLLSTDQFDLICMFQVFDHMNEPGMVLDECVKALKPGGGILILNHDIRALSARLMGERSPIIDIEHTYLYDHATIRKIVTQHGFKIKEIGHATNIISIRYLFQLLPLPRKLKLSLLSYLAKNPIGKITFPIQLGNLFLIAQK